MDPENVKIAQIKSRKNIFEPPRAERETVIESHKKFLTILFVFSLSSFVHFYF